MSSELLQCSTDSVPTARPGKGEGMQCWKQVGSRVSTDSPSGGGVSGERMAISLASREQAGRQEPSKPLRGSTG